MTDYVYNDKEQSVETLALNCDEETMIKKLLKVEGLNFEEEKIETFKVPYCKLY